MRCGDQKCGWLECVLRNRVEVMSRTCDGVLRKVTKRFDQIIEKHGAKMLVNDGYYDLKLN